jgi:hypothetical protein
VGLNQIPDGLLLPAPPAGFPAQAPNVFAIINSLDDALKMPYTMNMNLSISREFGNGYFVQAGYVGRQSRRSLISEDIAMPTNLRDPASGQTYFEAASMLHDYVNQGASAGSIPNIPFWENMFPGLATSTLTASQRAFNLYNVNSPDYTWPLYTMDAFCSPACSRLGPYAMYNRQYSYLRTLRSIGFGNYNAFQLTGRKRWNDGDQVELNYTFSKSIDLASTPENSTGTQGIIINAFSRRQFRAPPVERQLRLGHAVRQGQEVGHRKQGSRCLRRWLAVERPLPPGFRSAHVHRQRPVLAHQLEHHRLRHRHRHL